MFNFFGKKKEQETVGYKRPEEFEVSNLYVAKCETISSVNVGAGTPVVIKNFYLVSKNEEGKYFELFSGVKISEEEPHAFDEPQVISVEPVSNYLRAKDAKVISSDLAFTLFHYMNTRDMAMKLFEKDFE